MPSLKKKYTVNERNEPTGVILDLATYEKIEELLDDHHFGKLLEGAAKEKPIGLKEAKARYGRMKKPGVRKR